MNPLLLLRPSVFSIGLFALLFTSNSHGQNIPTFSSPSPYTAPSYPNFIEAAQAWEFSEMERLASTKAEKDYLSLFKAVQRENHIVIAQLASSWNTRPKSRLRSMAIALGRNNLSLGTAPSLLAQVGPEDPDYTTDLAMAQAFARGPEEELHWNLHKFSLPLHLNSSNNPIAEVQLNGKTYRFWLDTGAAMSVISEKVRKACNIPFLESNTDFEAGTGTQKMVGFRPGMVETLEFGGLTVKNHRVLVLKTSDLQMRILGIPLVKIDGIIGWPLLKQLDLKFDFPMNMLEVRQPEPRPGRMGGLHWYNSPFVPCHLPNGKRVNFMLDTGASETCFYSSSLDPLGLVPAGSSRVLRGSAGGKELSKTQVLKDVSFGFAETQVHIGHVEAYPKDSDTFPPMVLHGILGQDVLSQGILRIDWTNRHLSFILDRIVYD